MTVGIKCRGRSCPVPPEMRSTDLIQLRNDPGAQDVEGAVRLREGCPIMVADPMIRKTMREDRIFPLGALCGALAAALALAGCESGSGITGMRGAGVAEVA